MARKVGYWLGVAALAALAAWLVWRGWHAVPVADVEGRTDRFRVAVTVVALATLPWLGRERGFFGPVGGSVIARLVRVAGCAALCGTGLVVLSLDSHGRGGGVGSGTFSWPRQVAGLVLLVMLLAAPFVVRSRWPGVEASTLWCLTGVAGVVVLATAPVQTLEVVYVAGILAATSARSPMAPVTLAVGADAGLAAAPIVHELMGVGAQSGLAVLAVVLVAPVFLAAVVAAMAAAWLSTSGGAAPRPQRSARIQQGLLAGLASGAICGLIAPLLSGFLLFMLVLGPIVGFLGGALGAAIAADHPRVSRHQPFAARP